MTRSGPHVERAAPEVRAPPQAPEEDDPFDIRAELRAAPRPQLEPAGARSNIADFYKGRSVLITGASGFIGKVLIEKLLRTCPQLRRIFVLIRPKWNKQPAERLRALLEAPLFDGVRREFNLEQRVVLLEGDVTQRNLGLSKANLIRVCNEVSVIFHSAATIKFDEPLKQSVAINIAGTKNMVELCRRIPQLAALVHVSTAYANCDRDQVDEHVYPMDQGLDPERLVRMADWLDQDTMQELKRRLLDKRPNTYTYTKALAEWLLVRCARDLPVVVCRPSIVVASWREPFAGWIDNVNGPTGVVLGAGKGIIRTMLADKPLVADLVPVDMVISLAVALGWFAHLYNRNQLSEAAESLAGGALSCSSSSSARCSTISSRASESSASESSALASDVESYADDERNNGRLTPVGGAELDEVYEERAAGEDCASTDGAHEGRQADVMHAVESENSTGSSSNNNNQLDNINLNHADPTDERHLECSNQLQLEQQRRRHQHQHQHQHHQHHHRQDGPRTLSPSRLQQLDDGYGSSRSYAHSSKSSASSTSSASGCCLARRNSGAVSPASASLDHKVRQFRQRLRTKLARKGLPDELADVPVFHCTSGAENPITWGRIQVLILAFAALFPSVTTYRYPGGSFTSSKLKDDFHRLFMHYIPGYILDLCTQLAGGKPMLVKIFRKFDQAAGVLRAFTSRQWKFEHENRLALITELMNDEDRRLFNCDIKQLDWSDFCRTYVLGVRKFLLKEPMSNLAQARRNLTITYYRNLALEVASVALAAYCCGLFSYLPALARALRVF